MLTTTALPQTTRHTGNGGLFVLILDAQGKPFALAPIERLSHHPFPAAQIQVIDAAAHPLLQADHADVAPQPVSDESLVRQVESALKHLDDPVYLSEHPLASTPQVIAALDLHATRFARAKILRTQLEQAIEQLRPAGPVPARSSVPRRDWRPYLILHTAYVEGEHNNAIMNWLQVGEGTFNRIRRRALAAVAEVLHELAITR